MKQKCGHWISFCLTFLRQRMRKIEQVRAREHRARAKQQERLRRRSVESKFICVVHFRFGYMHMFRFLVGLCVEKWGFGRVPNVNTY